MIGLLNIVVGLILLLQMADSKSKILNTTNNTSILNSGSIVSNLNTPFDFIFPIPETDAIEDGFKIISTPYSNFSEEVIKISFEELFFRLKSNRGFPINNFNLFFLDLPPPVVS